MKWQTILYYANHHGRLETDASILIFDALMQLLNKRLGEIMGLRVELERREARSRQRRMAHKAGQERYGTRQPRRTDKAR